MPPQLSSQLERLSYTRRDLDLIDAEVDRLLTHFIPIIKNTGEANAGRLFLRVIEALVDKLNYNLDMRFRQSVYRTVSELQSALDISEITRYESPGTSASLVDLTLSTLGGPAGSGGIAVSQYQVFATRNAPIRQYIALEAYSVPEGATSLNPVSCVEGTRVVNQSIKASADGDPNEEIRLPVAKTPHEYIEIKVDAVTYTRVTDLKDSEPEDRHYMLRPDEDRYTTVIFGDGTYGLKLTPGAAVTATYIQCSGEAGNAPPGEVSVVVGSLSSQVSCTNPEAASGGFDGEEVEDIVRAAPRLASVTRGSVAEGQDFYRPSHERDFEALAERIPGVFRALAEDREGPVVNLYLLPTGAGVASASLLSTVESYFAAVKIHGATVNAYALQSAHIYVRMNVLLKTSKINKSVARRKVYEAIAAYKADGTVNEEGLLYYRNLTIGRGFAQSDLDAAIEGVDEGELVDLVDFEILTRYPTPVATNSSTTVSFDGEIVPQSTAEYASWSITATSTTEFALYKNGLPDSVGSIGVTHTSADGTIQFTLGKVTDTFVPSTDGWTFRTSAYRNNMLLDKFEFMELARDNDLQIVIFYPGELEIGS